MTLSILNFLLQIFFYLKIIITINKNVCTIIQYYNSTNNTIFLAL